MIEILNRWTRAVIYRSETADSIAAAVEEAMKSGSDLSGSDLSGSKNATLALAMTSICPAGELVVFKNCREGVVMLRIPADAKRSNATSRKCRAEFAVVVETPNHAPAHSRRDATFVYEEGATVRPREPWCENRLEEYASGIQFFITREEAKAYSC